ncbi:MAG: aldo/keto reductase [Actinomycetota bacterium]|nr:aldo/keto reductase [Actinomycetota bacterium]
MELRALGALQVSAVGLGCNNFGMRIDVEQTAMVVDAAIEAGINYFDTAESYGQGRSEEMLGSALRGRREQVLIATKWGHTISLADGERGGEPAQVRRRLEASLARLGTGYIDHFQLHRPDPLTPPEETLGCLEELRAEGKIREIGCTHFTADELVGSHDAAVAKGVHPYASIQNHYSLLTRAPETDGVFAACERLGVAFVPYFPLEAGLLTGKYRAGAGLPSGSRLEAWGSRATAFIDDAKLAVVERLIAWCALRGHSLLDLALSWQTSNPLVASVIAGATSPEQVRANVAAAGWALSADERVEVHGLLIQDG